MSLNELGRRTHVTLNKEPTGEQRETIRAMIRDTWVVGGSGRERRETLGTNKDRVVEAGWTVEG